MERRLTCGGPIATMLGPPMPYDMIFACASILTVAITAMAEIAVASENRKP